MSEIKSELFERLLDEFVERLRRGETPSISAYAAAHPDCADQIREFFPAVQAMEQLAVRRQHNPAAAVAAAGAPAQLGDFRIIREIGRGGMGIVYEAQQESLSRRVAVKVLPQSALLNPVSLQRFQRESRTAAQLHHTNVVPVFGVGEHQGYHYLVMQLIEGVGLDKILVQLVRDYGPALSSSPSTARPPKPTASKDKEGGDATAVVCALVLGEFSSIRAVAGSSIGLAAKVLRGNEPRSLQGERKPLPAAAATVALPNGQQETLTGSKRTPADASKPASASSGPPRLGPSYWRSVARIGVQVAEALHYAHQRGTLHRDIKPANLLIDLQGIVWVTDFGLAKAMEQDEVSQTGDIVGTVRYMAPERFHGEADARSDVYSLGLTLYELLTLRPAYEHPNPTVLMRRIAEEQPIGPRALNPAIPRDLETIVLKAVAREPAHRYPSAAALADDLGRFLEDRPILARRLNVAERLWRWSRRNRLVASLIGLAAALLVLVAVVASVGYVRTTRANVLVSNALAGQSQQREKAEALSQLSLEALDDIFEQYVPNRVVGASGLAINDSDGSAGHPSVQPVLSQGAAALLERMLVFYERLTQQNAADAGLRRKVADANRRVGDIHRRLGHLEQSQAAYLKAIQGYQQLQRETAGDSAAATEIARIYNEIGDLHWATRWGGDSRSFHATAMKTLTAAPAMQASLPPYRYELARTYYFLGRGSPPEAVPGRELEGDGPRRPGGSRREPDAGPAPAAGPRNLQSARLGDEEHLRHAITILEGLIEEQHGGADCRHLLACCYRDLPVTRQDSSPQSAFGSADKAIEILRKLVADFPDVPDYRFDLSKTYGKLDLRGRPLDANLCDVMEERLQQSLAISEKLVAENPNVPEYAASHVQTLYTLSEVLRRASRSGGAEATLRKALAVQSSLAEQFPKANAYIVWKTILQDSLAKLLSDHGRMQEARALLESAVAALHQLLQSEPQAAYVRGMLGRVYKNLSDVLRQMGDQQQADEMLRRGRDRDPDRAPE
jgi:serine/threonine protein kinase